MAIQDKWAWCSSCQALCFAGGSGLGTCPAGGVHKHVGSGNYALVDSDPTVPGQQNWRWCNRCQALAFAGHDQPGPCSAGGQHDHGGSGNYTLRSADSGAQGQRAWRWCRKCEVLAFAGGGSLGACAAGGQHDHAGSGEYVVAEHNRPFGPAPLWIMGHNTNSIQQVQAALDQGANAVEIDVTAYAHDLEQLCIDHAGVTGNDPGGKDAPAFIPFLHELRKVVDQRPALCMVMFDLKPPASHPEFGPVMMQAIRDILTSGTTLSVILSDATETGVFDAISKDVRAREGFMIDADSNVDRVVHFFADQHAVTRFGYGNGTSFPLSDEGAMVYRTPIEKACWLRATTARPRFVDAWTVNSVGNLQLYLRVGVDALICDPQGIERVRQLLQQGEFSQRYRLAQRSDDPMDPDNFAYGLSVVTSNIDSAGTDAKITFTLHGDKGSAATTVDTNFNARMEAGSTNFVVLHAPDLGTLTSISVKSDMTHNGPGWHLASITVQSHRYGGSKTAHFDTWIESTAAVTRNLG